MTLTELLVAMSILLVGIYAVAAGFPSLFGNLESERIRTEMARRVEARLENLKAAPLHIPEAITGHDPLDGTVIPPELYPDESMDPIPGNPRDDLIWVMGESFDVPVAEPGETFSVYPLNLGPATVEDPGAVGDYLQVARLVTLQRTDEGMPLGNDQFYLDEQGYLHAPPAFEMAQVDYVWVDADGVQHGVLREIVENVEALAGAAPVRASLVTDPAFANVLPELASADAFVPYTTALGGPTDVASGVAVLESTWGATLLLPIEDARERMQVTYRLRTEPDSMTSPRRAPIMAEEMPAPTRSPYRVDLAFRGIDDETPLFTEDLLGNPLADPVYVLIVDVLTGETWTDVEDWVTLDFIEGRLTLDWENAAAPFGPVQARGRDLRVYYRTIGAHTIVVQKAPAWFVEDTVAQTYIDDGLGESVDYRYYSVEADPDDAAYTRLLFPMSAADQMVLVDYVVLEQTPGGVRLVKRVNGELHAVPGETLAVTLNEPMPLPDGAVGILGVRGVSLTVRGWWRDQTGRVQMVGIDTFLTPEPLL